MSNMIDFILHQLVKYSIAAALLLIILFVVGSVLAGNLKWIDEILYKLTHKKPKQ